MKARILRWGNSLAVRIPQVIAKDARLKQGDVLELVANEEGNVEIRRESKVPTLSQLVAGITPENQHGEISTGASDGRETPDW